MMTVTKSQTRRRARAIAAKQKTVDPLSDEIEISTRSVPLKTLFQHFWNIRTSGAVVEILIWMMESVTK